MASGHRAAYPYPKGDIQAWGRVGQGRLLRRMTKRLQCRPGNRGSAEGESAQMVLNPAGRACTGAVPPARGPEGRRCSLTGSSSQGRCPRATTRLPWLLRVPRRPTNNPAPASIGALLGHPKGRTGTGCAALIRQGEGPAHLKSPKQDGPEVLETAPEALVRHPRAFGHVATWAPLLPMQGGQ